MSWKRVKFKQKGKRFMNEKRFQSVAKRWREEEFGKAKSMRSRSRRSKLATLYLALDINGNAVAHFDTEEEVKDFINNNRGLATRWQCVNMANDTTYINSNCERTKYDV